MTNQTICIGDHFRTVANVLDIKSFVGRRLVLNASPAVSNEGSFSAQSVQPGLNHIDTTQTWTNTDVVDMWARVEAMAFSRRIKTSQPNLTFIRHRVTAGVGGADDPDLISIDNPNTSDMGGGFNLHDAAGATPAGGVFVREQGIMVTVLDDIKVPAGQTLTIKYRCAHFSLDPFATNANNNSPTYEAFARGVLIQVWAAPTGFVS